MNVGIFTTLAMALAIIGLVAWLFRPNSKKYYEKLSRLVLKEERSPKKAAGGKKSEKQK